MTLQPGQRVRCVDSADAPWLTQGAEYIIASIGRDAVILRTFPGQIFITHRFKPVVRVPWVLAS